MIIAFILIVIHYIADFMFQTEKMAIGKHKSMVSLLHHTATYTFIFYLFFALWCMYQNHIGHQKPEEMGLDSRILLFFPITFVCHTVIDYVSSRISHKKFEKKEYYTGLPNFGAFSIIGLDQVFHYGSLFLTYHFLTT